MKSLLSPGELDAVRRASHCVGAPVIGVSPPSSARSLGKQALLDGGKKEEPKAPTNNAFFMPSALNSQPVVHRLGAPKGDDDNNVRRKSEIGQSGTSPKRIPTYEKMFNEITRGYLKESDARPGGLKPPGPGGRRNSVQSYARRQSMSNADRAAWGLPPMLFQQAQAELTASPRGSGNNTAVKADTSVSRAVNQRRSLVVFGRTSLEKKNRSGSDRVSARDSANFSARICPVVEEDEFPDCDSGVFEDNAFRHSTRRLTADDDDVRISVFSMRPSESMGDGVLVLRTSLPDLGDNSHQEWEGEEIVVPFCPVLDVVSLRKWLQDGVKVTRRNVESLAHLYQYAMRYMLLSPDYTFDEFRGDIESGRKDVLRVILRDNTPYVSRTVRRAKALAQESGRSLTLTLDQQLTELFHMQYHYKTITSARPVITRSTFNPSPKKKERKEKRRKQRQNGGWVVEAKQLALETSEQKESLWKKINTYFHVRNHIGMVSKSSHTVDAWHDNLRLPGKPEKPKEGLRPLPKERMRWLMSQQDPYGRKAAAAIIPKKKKKFFPILSARAWNHAPRMTREELFKTVMSDGDSWDARSSDSSSESESYTSDSASSSSGKSIDFSFAAPSESPRDKASKSVNRRHSLDSYLSPRVSAAADDARRRLSGFAMTRELHVLANSDGTESRTVTKDAWRTPRGPQASCHSPGKNKFGIGDDNKTKSNQAFINHMLNHVGANDRANIESPLHKRRNSVELQRRASVELATPMVRITTKAEDNFSTPIRSSPSPKASIDHGSGGSPSFLKRRNSAESGRATGRTLGRTDTAASFGR